MIVLFLGLDQNELSAYRKVSSIVRDETGVEFKIVTHRADFALSGELCIGDILQQNPHLVNDAGTDVIASNSGLCDISELAAFDRDWYSADTAERRKFARSVSAATLNLLDTTRPDLIVSAIGGETMRCAVEMHATSRDIPRAYFNSVPETNRFVLTKAQTAPFIPHGGTDSSYHPSQASSESAASYPPLGRLGQAPRQVSALNGIKYLASLLRMTDQRSFPRAWPYRKTVAAVDAYIAKARPDRRAATFDKGKTCILYPLHDEEDFQVAVRERHALPQTALIKYVSTILDDSFTLYLKPHPEHLSAHHPRKWKTVASRPNVVFLPPSISGAEALEQCDVVLTLASSMGYEALKLGKPVVCYGRPFYAGRGVTIDVSDVRETGMLLRKARSWKPRTEDVDKLQRSVMDWSWPGSYTPLVLTDDNARSLSRAVIDAIQSTT